MSPLIAGALGLTTLCLVLVSNPMVYATCIQVLTCGFHPGVFMKLGYNQRVGMGLRKSNLDWLENNDRTMEASHHDRGCHLILSGHKVLGGPCAP